MRMSSTGDASETNDDVQFQEYSQPLFTENQDEFPSSVSSTGCNDGDASETYDDVQFQEYSQPLFTENQDELPSSVSSTGCNDGTNNQSQSLIQSTIIINKKRHVPEEVINENKESCKIQNDYGEYSNPKRNKVEESCENVAGSGSNEECIHFVFDKELDKRNYYFGNLLIGELQFLPPCMRSHAYITILKYVETLKHKHLNNN